MTQWKALSGTTAFFIATAGLAQADVTGAEVWANWKAAGESMGQSFAAGAEVQAGDTLTISDLAIDMVMEEATASGTIDMIEFRDRPDGTVQITLSPSYAMTLNVTPANQDPVDVDLLVSQEGMTIVASGGEGEIAYDFVAPEITVSVERLVAEGEPLEITAIAAFLGMNGNYVLTEAEMPMITSKANADRFTFELDMSEPGGGDGSLTMNIDFADITSSSEGAMSMIANPEDIAALLKAGMATSGMFSHGASSYDFDFQDGSDTFTFAGSADAGALEVSLDAEALSYSVSNSGLSIAFSGSDIPLPEVAAAFGEIGFGFLMPVSASDAPQAFGLGITLADLTVSDMIWGMIDSGAMIPRDPATLIVDVSGMANWFFDIMDPEAAEQMGAGMPGELHAFDINELELSVGGAELTGNGSFTFDNDDLETFDGLPAPTGRIDLQLVGANALLDTLVTMGLVPEDQAMGARMMMGMFARPGGGEDTLVSTIEVDGATGAISANGQRLQ